MGLGRVDDSFDRDEYAFFYTISGYPAIKNAVLALTPTPLPEGEGLVRRIVNTP